MFGRLETQPAVSRVSRSGVWLSCVDGTAYTSTPPSLCVTESFRCLAFCRSANRADHRCLRDWFAERSVVGDATPLDIALLQPRGRYSFRVERLLMNRANHGIVASKHHGYISEDSCDDTTPHNGTVTLIEKCSGAVGF